MNYQKIYNDICLRGQTRILEKGTYSEKHHIIPKCLGGSNDKSNISKLTAREHFLVHYILATKLYPKHKGLFFALWKMLVVNNETQQRYLPNSKYIEEIKKNMNLQKIGHVVLPETRNKISQSNKGKKRSDEFRKTLKRHGSDNPHFGKSHSDEAKKKMSEKAIGRTVSPETRKKISLAFTGKNHPLYGKPMSEETKKKIGNANSGKKRTAEVKKKITDNNFKSWTPERKKLASLRRTGQKHTLETIEKMKLAWKMKKLNANLGV